MKPFIAEKGVIALLDRANVDTDQIIPKQFLKSIKRTGFETQLFYDWRYLENGSDNPDFELNQPRYKNAKFLLTRNNFGCGSSREHAVWAIHQYGFKSILAPRKKNGEAIIPGFADIFRNNCVKNGILPIELAEETVNELFKLVETNPGLETTINLQEQTLTFHAKSARVERFEIDPQTKDHLMKGLDDIQQTLEFEAQISAFETSHNTQISNQ